MTEGRSFQLGLKRRISKPSLERSWYHLDNGFSSADAMAELHAPIVALASRVLDGATGNVLDLGCGNAALLAKICDGKDGLVPYGVDSSRDSLDHAAALLPRAVANFKAADLFDTDAWAGGPRYALSLLMVGRLLEVASPIAYKLLKILQAQSDAILLYAYPGGGGQTLDAVVRKLGLRVDAPPHAIAGMLMSSELLHGAGAPAATMAAALPEIDTSRHVVELDRPVEVISTVASPRVVLLANVLSAEECDALVEQCLSRMAPSKVIADAEGSVRIHENRTSHDAMLRRGETELIARIEARLAALARWPVECSEGLQVVRYDPTEEYRAHCDWIDPAVPGLREQLERGGQRLGTFILYLSDVEAGGETSFPAIGLRVSPRKGSAVFFLNTDAHHVPDSSTLHAGCPVIKGVKFVANKWLRERVC